MTSAKRSTSMTLDRALLEEARQLGINLSRAAESGLAAAIKAERSRLWRDENKDAIAEYNLLVEREGLPLASYRKF